MCPAWNLTLGRLEVALDDLPVTTSATALTAVLIELRRPVSPAGSSAFAQLASW